MVECKNCIYQIPNWKEEYKTDEMKRGFCSSKCEDEYNFIFPMNENG